MDISHIIMIIITIILLLVIAFQYCVIVTKLTSINIKKEHKISEIIKPIITTPVPPHLLPQTHDPIKDYDYNKLMNPLEEPTKRVDRYLLGPLDYRHMFNYPVRGYPDNPRWLGILINEQDTTDNRILKLFGRQKYPKSDHYEYYTMINMGFDQIKVHIKRRKELYDHDTVDIPELGKTYSVKLNKDDDYQYFV